MHPRKDKGREKENDTSEGYTSRKDKGKEKEKDTSEGYTSSLESGSEERVNLDLDAINDEPSFADDEAQAAPHKAFYDFPLGSVALMNATNSQAMLLNENKGILAPAELNRGLLYNDVLRSTFFMGEDFETSEEFAKVLQGEKEGKYKLHIDVHHPDYKARSNELTEIKNQYLIRFMSRVASEKGRSIDEEKLDVLINAWHQGLLSFVNELIINVASETFAVKFYFGEVGEWFNLKLDSQNRIILEGRISNIQAEKVFTQAEHKADKSLAEGKTLLPLQGEINYTLQLSAENAHFILQKISTNNSILRDLLLKNANEFTEGSPVWDKLQQRCNEFNADDFLLLLKSCPSFIEKQGNVLLDHVLALPEGPIKSEYFLYLNAVNALLYSPTSLEAWQNASIQFEKVLEMDEAINLEGNLFHQFIKTGYSSSIKFLGDTLSPEWNQIKKDLDNSLQFKNHTYRRFGEEIFVLFLQTYPQGLTPWASDLLQSIIQNLTNPDQLYQINMVLADKLSLEEDESGSSSDEEEDSDQDHTLDIKLAWQLSAEFKVLSAANQFYAENQSPLALYLSQPEIQGRFEVNVVRNDLDQKEDYSRWFNSFDPSLPFTDSEIISESFLQIMQKVMLTRDEETFKNDAEIWCNLVKNITLQNFFDEEGDIRLDVYTALNSTGKMDAHITQHNLNKIKAGLFGAYAQAIYPTDLTSLINLDDASEENQNKIEAFQKYQHMVSQKFNLEFAGERDEIILINKEFIDDVSKRTADNISRVQSPVLKNQLLLQKETNLYNQSVASLKQTLTNPVCDPRLRQRGYMVLNEIETIHRRKPRVRPQLTEILNATNQYIKKPTPHNLADYHNTALTLRRRPWGRILAGLMISLVGVGLIVISGAVVGATLGAALPLGGVGLISGALIAAAGAGLAAGVIGVGSFVGGQTTFFKHIVPKAAMPKEIERFEEVAIKHTKQSKHD